MSFLRTIICGGNYFEKDFPNCSYQTKIIRSFTSRTNYPISEWGKEQLTIVPEYLMLVISFHCMLIAFTMCFKFFKISLNISKCPLLVWSVICVQVMGDLLLSRVGNMKRLLRWNIIILFSLFWNCHHLNSVFQAKCSYEFF